MRRWIVCCALVLLAAAALGCQPLQLNINAHRNSKQNPSIESLVPGQTPAAEPKKPAVEIKTPAVLAGGETPPQPKEQYAPQPKTARVHTVQGGETLFSIARQYYGDQQQWRRIYQANLNRIQDPQHVRVGMKLIIP